MENDLPPMEELMAKYFSGEASPEEIALLSSWVKKDEKYTVRDIFYNDDIVTSIVVVELKNPILFFPNTINRYQEASFRIDRFREIEYEVEELVNEKVEELVNID